MHQRPPKGWSITRGEFFFLLIVTSLAFAAFPLACTYVPRVSRWLVAVYVFLPWAACMGALFTRHDRVRFRVALAILAVVSLGSLVAYFSHF